MTTGNATAQLPDNSPAQNTRSLLRSIYRTRLPVWIFLAIVIFAACLFAGLFLYPQTYTSMNSISLSQPSGGNSQLAMLTGGGGTKAKYLGPLKSRRFAEQVENTAHLKELYHLSDMDDAVEKLQRGVRFDDNTADGLLYISMSLDAPAKMAANSDATRKRVREATATVCDAYALALKTYIIYNDTDKDSVLRRSADDQMKQARANYDAAVDKWINFVRDSKSTSVGASGSSQSPELAALQALFIRRGQLEAQVRSSDASISATKGQVGADTSHLVQIPTEDLLLTEARRRYTEASREVQDLRIQYADESPPVRRAKERLQIASAHLHDQVEAILHGNTSENTKRHALQVEYESVVEQIAALERTIHVSKSAATGFERLHSEVDLNLKVLEATATRQADLKMQTGSQNSRLFVVDKARAPTKSRPGMLMTSLVSALLAIGTILLWYGIEYTLRASRLAAQTTPTIDAANTGAKP